MTRIVTPFRRGMTALTLLSFIQLSCGPQHARTTPVPTPGSGSAAAAATRAPARRRSPPM